MPINSPEIRPILVGMSSWAMAIVTEKDAQSKKPKVSIAAICRGPCVRRIAANAGMAPSVVATTTGFLPTRSETYPPGKLPDHAGKEHGAHQKCRLEERVTV